jgi:hypothetical protein
VSLLPGLKSSIEETREYQEVIGSNFPTLNGTWCMVDGLKIPIKKYGDESIHKMFYNGLLQKIPIQKYGVESIHKMFYNGLLHNHYVRCIFAFVPIWSCCFSAYCYYCHSNAPPPGSKVYFGISWLDLLWSNNWPTRMMLFGIVHD